MRYPTSVDKIISRSLHTKQIELWHYYANFTLIYASKISRNVRVKWTELSRYYANSNLLFMGALVGQTVDMDKDKMITERLFEICSTVVENME